MFSYMTGNTPFLHLEKNEYLSRSLFPMKKQFLIALFIVGSLSAMASQPGYAPDRICLETGVITTTAEVQPAMLFPSTSSEVFQGRFYRLMQFAHPLTASEKQAVERAGIRLLDYIPYNTWFVSLPASGPASGFSALPVRTVLAISVDNKMNRALREQAVPAHAWAGADKVLLQCRLFSDVDMESAVADLKSRDVRVLSSDPRLHRLNVELSSRDISSFVALSFVKYAEPISAPPVPEDTRGRSLHRSNAINVVPVFGRHFNGDSVTISLADDGEVGPHIDFKGRLTSLMSGAGGNHGDMTSGIAVGAGNLDPVIRGMADGANILIHDIGNYEHIYNSPAFFSQYGAVITSTSYSQGCNDYNTDSQDADQLAYDNPLFSFVFSAGNRGQSDCGYGAGSPWGSITGGMKIGKNVISCANLDAYEVRDATSSCGPADDGRIKPEIAANGADQLSTDEGNTYQVGGGTSAACPGIAGVTAQLVQAYRSLNNGQNPEAAILKSVLLNGAQDIGNPGPDFYFGFGRVNALRALRALEDGRYRIDSLGQGDTITFTINVPSNIRQAKVMLYWPESPGDPAAAFQLVNDADLQVSDGSTTFLPWVLDPTPNPVNLNAPAVRAVDHLNNIEQVTIDQPAAGVLTVTIIGNNIPLGVQRCFTTWDFVESGVTLTYPLGGEAFVAGETELIRWDAFGSTGTFDLEYSTDAGSTWQAMASVGGDIRQYDWQIPSSLSSDLVVIRVTRGVEVAQNNPFVVILPQPSNLQVDFSCTDTLQLSWTAAPGINTYDVYRLGNKYMEVVATVTGNTVQLPVPANTEEWFSVGPVGPAGGQGRRLTAIQKTPGLLNCSYAADMAVVQAVRPQPGLLYACQNLTSIPITMALRNDGLNDATGFDISYSINGNSPVLETYPGTLTHGSSLSFTFAVPADFSVPGTYTIVISVALPGDLNYLNDSIQYTVTSSPTATVPLAEDFQAPVFPPVNWSVVSSGTTYRWDVATVVGSDGLTTRTAWFDDFSYNSPGAEDDLILPVTDLSSLSNPILTFDVAYAVYSTGYDDGLRVEISTDCGQTFQPTGYEKIGSALATVPPSSSDWEPVDAASWRNDTVDLSTFSGQSVILKFVNINDYGNNIYVDNINLKDNGLSTISESEFQSLTQVYPNPFTNLFHVRASGFTAPQVGLEIRDLQGRLVRSQPVATVNGIASVEMDLGPVPAGVYVGQWSSGNEVRTFRLIKR